MIYYKTPSEIELIRESSLLVSKTHAYIAGLLHAGMTALELDRLAEQFILEHGAKPAFKGYRGFPGTLCVSVNETVVHGIPGDVPFREGDVVSVDCGVLWNGFYGDVAYTYAIGEVNDDILQLLLVTRECLAIGIEAAIPGNRIGDIGAAIQHHAEITHGYGVVRDLVGHGVGKNLHEAPDVPNFGKRGSGPLIKPGLVIAIEPMINLGTRLVRQLKDGWTINTKDGQPSAHYEHTVAITEQGADILSDHDMIDAAIAKNRELMQISIKC